MTGSAALLLELQRAVTVARRSIPYRQRTDLERAVAEVQLAARAGALALAPTTPAAAIEYVRAAVHLARDLGVDWPEVVAIVNREG